MESELEAEAGMSAESCKEGIVVVPVRAEVSSDRGGGSGDRELVRSWTACGGRASGIRRWIGCESVWRGGL